MTRNFDRSKRTNRRPVPRKPSDSPPVLLPDPTRFFAELDAQEDARTSPCPPPPPPPKPAPPAEGQ